jgi:hypothetical protein
MAMSAIADVPKMPDGFQLPRVLQWEGPGPYLAFFLDHYRVTLKQIREAGYVRYTVRQFRPYLYAAVTQFSPARRSRRR